MHLPTEEEARRYWIERKKFAQSEILAAVAYARPDGGDHVGMSRNEAQAFEDALILVEEYAAKLVSS